MEPVKQEEHKVDVGDVIFYLLLIVALLFFIPFYSGIFEILKYASQIMVGMNTYIGLGGVVLGLSNVLVGFKKKISVVKILGLLVMIGCMLLPFYEYIGSRSYLKEVLGEYTFDKLLVIAHNDCEMEKQLQAEVASKFSSELGEEGEIDVDNLSTTDPTNGTIKDKIRCMPSTTHLMYRIAYKDSRGCDRIIVYDGKNNFVESLSLESYKILNEELEDYLNFKKGKGKASHNLKFYSKGKGFVDITNSNLITEKIALPYPSTIMIDNFYQDSRLIVELTFELAVDKTLAKEIVEELDEKFSQPITAIIHYGKNTEYYFQKNWYQENENTFIKRLSGNA